MRRDNNRKFIYKFQTETLSTSQLEKIEEGFSGGKHRITSIAGPLA